VVDAFLAASRGGDLGALLAVLDPDIVVRADEAAVQLGAAREVRGAEGAAEFFLGRARGAQPALVDGVPGLVWAPGGRPKVAFAFTVTDGRVVEIHLHADPERLDPSVLEILDT